MLMPEFIGLLQSQDGVFRQEGGETVGGEIEAWGKSASPDPFSPSRLGGSLGHRALALW